MYYAHFGLTRPPFRITPDTTLFFSGADRGSVLEALHYVVMTGEGITKVIGEVGSGKTMLCRMLEEKLPQDVETVYIGNPNIDAENILNVIAFEAGLTSKPANKLELMQWLQDWLLKCHVKGRRVVVLIEEAQGMPLETLEEIRLLSNLETGEDKLLQIVLFGQPELDEKLGKAEIRQLQDRIAHNFYLSPLTRQQIREYANFRMRQAGYHGPDLFDDKVCKVLAKHSKGLIRRVNILADKTLLAAFSASTTQLLPRHAETASRDSHFTDTRKSIDPLWLFVAGGIVGGFLLAVLLVWIIWPGTPRPVADRVQHITKPEANPSVESSAGKPAALSTPAIARQVRDPATSVSVPADNAISETAQETPAENTDIVDSQDHEQLEQDVAAILAQSLLENRIAATRKWLSGAESDLYTIQLMTLKADSAENLNKYLTRLPGSIDINDIFIYETEISGDPMFGVLYQQFDSREEAQARMNDMPAAFKRIKPYLLRSVRGVRNEIARGNG